MSLPPRPRIGLCGLLLTLGGIVAEAQLPMGSPTGITEPDGAGLVPVRPTVRPTALGRFRPVRGAAGQLPGARRGFTDTPPTTQGLADLGTARSYEFLVSRDIPDDDPSGLADTRLLPSSGLAIRSVSVALTLSPQGEGGFLGDLYATLVNEAGGYAVLLNRPGRQLGRPFGYSDGVGASITFADEAAADVHQYRLTLTGREDMPLAAPLGGIWQPDARAADPMLVSLGGTRSAFLTSFAGLDAGGRWTLFLADVSRGGAYRLDSWTLSVNYVPEPTGLIGALGLVGLAWVILQRRSRRF